MGWERNEGGKEIQRQDLLPPALLLRHPLGNAIQMSFMLIHIISFGQKGSSYMYMGLDKYVVVEGNNT